MMNLLAICLGLGVPLTVAGKRFPEFQNIDYVVVGGGVSGLVVAEQLSRDPQINVVVLEAGPDGTNDARINTPAYAGQLTGSSYTWNFTSQPDHALDGATPILTQGRGWGGGSMVNYMVYCRGAASVFDEWADVSGNEGLRWDNLFEDFKATTHYKAQDLHYDTHLNPAAYGDGPIEVTSSRDTLGFSLRYGNALSEVLDLPFVDFNDGTGIGVSINPHTIRASNRTRHYALSAYGWQMADRPNVRMLHDAWVSNIGFEGHRATNVTVHLSDRTNQTICAKEIILAAGALNSPKLLMLSGVGPKQHLEDLGIPVVADIPAVGSHLYDHHVSSLEYEVRQPVQTAWQWSVNSTFQPIAESQYANHGNGPLGSQTGTAFALARVPDDIYNAAESPYTPPLPPDRGNLLFQCSLAAPRPDSPNTSTITPFVALVQPQAHGHLRLASHDFRAAPLLFSNYFGSPGDKAAMLYGYKKLREIVANQHTAPLIVREIFPGAHVTSDEELWRAIQRSARTFYHPVCTVGLGRVLDGQWRVKGLEGIRVVDSSTFPSLPNCATQGTVYAYAHHVAQVIRREDGKKYGRF